MQLLFFAVDKTEKMGLKNGALYAIVSILMVFAVLILIIGITTLIFKLNGLFEMKAEIDAAKKQEQNQKVSAFEKKEDSNLVEIKDDDMLTAVLVATIDYRQEIKKDVRVISIKEIK